jgi:uncharacterized membrane protein
MNLVAPLSGYFLWFTLAISAFSLGWILRISPWRSLAAIPVRQHMWFGVIIGLGIYGALVQLQLFNLFRLHPLLMAACTAIFGARLTIVAGFFALLISHAFSILPWQNIGFNFLVSVLVPVFIARGVFMLIARSRIQNLFLYTLGGGFIGGMLSWVGSAIFAVLFLWLSQAAFMPDVWENAWMFFLLTFPEGFCNGAIVTCMAVLSPHLVKTYDDDFYLQK